MTYIELLTKFVEGNLKVDDLETLFLDKFKQECHFISDKEFKILEKFFEDVDSYYNEENELFDPDFDLTEEELRKSAEETLILLKAL